jgi:MFS family permease
LGVLRDRNLQMVIAVVVFAVTGGSLVGPILPAMLDPLRVSEEQVGLVLSAYTFWAMISTPLLGLLADKAGRKPVLAAGTLLFGVAGVGIAFCRSFPQVLLLRSLQGIAVGGMMNTGVTLIGDLFTGYERVQAMGYRISFQTVTNSFIPFISGGLATLAWFYPFLIYALSIPVGAGVLLRMRLPPLSREKRPARREYFLRVLRILGSRRSLWVFFSNFMAFFLLYALVVYMPILLVRQLGLSTFHAGLAMTFAAGTAALASSQAGAIRRRLSEYAVIGAGFLCCGTALAGLTVSQGYPALLGCMVLWGAGFGLLMPALNTCAAGLAPAKLRAGVVSVFTTMIYLGQTLSPLVFGYLLARTDLDTLFVVAGGLAALPLAFTLAESASARGATA